MAPELLRYLRETHGQQLTPQLRVVAVYGTQGSDRIPSMRNSRRSRRHSVCAVPRGEYRRTSSAFMAGDLDRYCDGCTEDRRVPVAGAAFFTVNRHMTRRVAWELATARVSGGPVPCRPCPDRLRARAGRPGFTGLRIARKGWPAPSVRQRGRGPARSFVVARCS